jgi:diguanylate cyclase (GGDEF)-like protein/PAS domain S-box-containing protein
MHVVAGNGSGEDRNDPAARLLALTAHCVSCATEDEVMHQAVQGIADIFDVGCLAVTVGASGTLTAAAWSADATALAQAVNASRLALTADALVGTALMSGTWHVLRDGGLSSALLALHPQPEPIAAAIAVPLRAGLTTYGAWVAYAARETAFPSRHAEALASAGAVIAADLDRRAAAARALAGEQHRAAMLKHVERVHSSLDESEVLGAAADICRILSRADWAIVWQLSGNRFVARTILGDETAREYASHIVANADPNMPLGGGPLGKAARTGRPQHVADTLSDRGFAPWVDEAQRYGVRSLIALPLADAAQTALVVELDARSADAFGEKELSDLEMFLPHARQAVAQARATIRASRVERAAAAAAAAAASISRTLSEAEVARSIARAAGEALGAACAVTYTRDGETLTQAGAWRAPADLAARLQAVLREPAAAVHPAVQAAGEQRLVIRTNLTTDPSWIRLGWEQLARRHEFNAVVAFPLLDGDKVVGAVACFLREAPDDEADVAAEVARAVGRDGGAALAAVRAYDQATAARDFLDRILEESSDAIVQIDVDGRVAGWNKGAERIFGVGREDVVGKSFADLPIIPVERREDVRELLSRVARGEHVPVFEIACRARDGRDVLALVSASPARDDQGRIVGLVAFSKDISEQAHKLDHVMRQNRALSLVRGISLALGRELSMTAVARQGLDQVLQALTLGHGRLYVYDAAESRLYAVAQRGFRPEGCEPVAVRPVEDLPGGPLAAAVVYRQTLVHHNGGSVVENPALADRQISDVSAVITRPLVAANELIGVLQLLAFDGRRFGPDDESIVHAAGDELAAALRHARMLDEASRLAITDPLTGLYNYRFTQDVLRKRLSEVRRRKRPLAVIMADIDGLQTINERYGREAGDKILRQFGAVLAACVRVSDIVARYGGDEFLIVLPETRLTDAVMLAERTLTRIAETTWEGIEAGGGEDVTVTASFGVAAYPEAGTQLNALLKAADAELFAAKQSGRNTVSPRLESLPRFAG